MSGELVALVTCPQTLAEKIAASLVEKQVAACVNVVASVTSIYTWEGKIEKDEESLLVIKTNQMTFESFKTAVQEVHPYDVPEIIALPIEKGNSEYLAWLNKSVTNK